MSVKLVFSALGEGPPIVILHGLFGSGRNWQTIARGLADDHRVYLPDLRNHGRSPWTATMTYSEMVEDLNQFFADHGIIRTVLIGHSMGGKTAMLFALLHAQLVDALIVVDIAPVAYSHTFLPYVAAMQRLDLSAGARREALAAGLADAVPEAALRTFLLQNLVRRHGHFAWRINLDAIGAQMAALTGFPDTGELEYDGATLFVSGDGSDYLAATHQPVIRRLFPDAQFAVVPQAGHRVHADQPERFLGCVRSFLEEI
jgi:pimeloyl-ACP methyl ester carboxylesterase